MKPLRLFHYKKGIMSFDAGLALLTVLFLIFASLSIISNQHTRIANSLQDERMEILALEASDFLLRSGLTPTEPRLFTYINHPHKIDQSLFTDETAAHLRDRLKLQELRACILRQNGIKMRCAGSGGSTCIRRLAIYQKEVVILETCIS